MVAVKTIPLLDDLREISAAQREEFRENGHLLVRGMLSPGEMTIYRMLIQDAVKKYRTDRRRSAEKKAPGKPSEIVNLWRADAGVRRLVMARRLAKVAADLLGVTNVRIYHDEVLLKEPGGGPGPWRQDQYGHPLNTTDTITVWVPLADLPLDMGTLTFASGSHHHGTVSDQIPEDQSESGYRKYIRDLQFPVTRAAGMRAGDTIWYYGDTAYRVPANDSDRTREVMTVIYMADGARVTQPVNKIEVKEWNAWLMGLPPGRLAASELNPLVL